MLLVLTERCPSVSMCIICNKYSVPCAFALYFDHVFSRENSNYMTFTSFVRNVYPCLLCVTILPSALVDLFGF